VLADAQVEILGEVESIGDDRRLIATICEFSTACEISAAAERIVPVSGRAPASLETVGVPAIEGTTVFVGQGPTVKAVLPPGSFQAWVTVASTNSGLPEAKPARVSADGVVGYEPYTDAATKVAIWVEPVGLAPRSWLPELMQTEFVVFPARTTLVWPVIPLSFDEAPRLIAEGNAISDVRANGLSLVRGADGWLLLPNHEVVVLVITTPRGLSVQITRRVRRIHIQAPEIEAFVECPVFFLSDFERNTPLVIDLPESAAGAALDVGLAFHDALNYATTVVVPQAVKRSHAMRFSSRVLRDALAGASQGLVALRIDHRVVKTGALYVREPLDLLFPEEPAGEDLGLLEGPLGDTIRRFDELRDHPVEIQMPVPPTRDPLRALMLRITTIAAILDQRDAGEDAGESSDLSILRVAMHSAQTGEPVGDDLLVALSDLPHDPMIRRIPRWADQLASMISGLREQSDSRLIIQRWTDCWNGRVLNEEAVAETLLYRMSGGLLLTEGARKLFIALRAHQKIGFLSGPDGALECLTRAATAGAPTVSAVATALRIGAHLLMSDVDGARRLLGELPATKSPVWHHLAGDLDAIIAGDPLLPREAGSASVRVWDIEPEGITLFDTHGGD
jgi:hypothetical protein